MQVFLCRATVLLWYGLCSEEQTLHEVEGWACKKARQEKNSYTYLYSSKHVGVRDNSSSEERVPYTLFDLASAGELAHTHHGTEAHKIFLRSYILPAHRGGTMLCSAKPVAACRATFLHCSRRERVGTSL